MARSAAGYPGNPFRGRTPKPITFVEIETGVASPSVLRYTDAPVASAVTWDSKAWSPRTMSLPEIRQDGPGEAGGFSLRLGDADFVFRDLIDVQKARFTFTRVRMYVTDVEEVIAGTTKALRELLFCDGFERGEGYCVLSLRSLFAVAALTPTPRRTLNRRLFPGMPPNP